MQIDDPVRGFSVKHTGPLDMRMNPNRGRPASALLEKITTDALARLLADHADEPHAAALGGQLAGRTLTTTAQLANAIRAALPGVAPDGHDLSVRRVFQACASP
jgi:16S rRNA (cytosine1402-N4)-methyltransferase